MRKKLQLFLLPFAGGNANSFYRLLPFLAPEIEAITIEYSGRLARRREGYIDDYETFLVDVASQIAARRDVEKDYALFGYSLGSALVFDLLSRKMIEGTARHVFLCSMGGLAARTDDMGDEYTEEEFLDEIYALGGTDEQILKDKRFQQVFLEPVKADFKVWSSFVFKTGVMPCNATAIYCKDDPVASNVHDWSGLTDGIVDYYEMGENHFFINKYYKDVAEIVNSHLSIWM